VVDAATGVSGSGILDIVDTVGSEDVAGEGAQPGEDTGILANAGGVLVEGGVVMGTVFDPPVSADGCGRIVGAQPYVADIVGDDVVGHRPVAALRSRRSRVTWTTAAI
jgi:hypothetical protein